jgi:non-homologous end joining protein Ku
MIVEKDLFRLDAEKGERAAENVVDLMDALKKNLGQSKSAPQRASSRRRPGAA